MSIQGQKRTVHFIGIGGVGMSGIAELLAKLGHKITGSDLAQSEAVQRLVGLGATVQIGHGTNILQQHKPDVCVYSTAVDNRNPEIEYCRVREIPVIRRAEMLAELMRLKRGIAVAGAHGKTTTTGMLSMFLQAAGLEPTVVIGGRFDAFGSNAAWGGGQWMVAEADESDGSFLRLSPELAIVTNIDREHLDHYGRFEDCLKAFIDFIDRLPFYGRAILSSDCEHLRALRGAILKPRLWYGVDRSFEPDVLIEALELGARPKFRLLKKSSDYKDPFFEGHLSVPGLHNIKNATAALMMAAELGVDLEKVKSAVLGFRGVQRRFELKGQYSGHPIVEDYAHHPTEIRATLAAALGYFENQKPLVVFQPHRFTRTRDQWTAFQACFEGASAVITLPIYAASEPKDSWTRAFDGENFSKNIQGVPAHFADSHQAAIEICKTQLKGAAPGSPVLVLGAGDVYKVALALVSQTSDAREINS